MSVAGQPRGKSAHEVTMVEHRSGTGNPGPSISKAEPELSFRFSDDFPVQFSVFEANSCISGNRLLARFSALRQHFLRTKNGITAERPDTEFGTGTRGFRIHGSGKGLGVYTCTC